MYQIRFSRNGGCSYAYFNAEPGEALEAACEAANDYLEQRRSRLTSWAFKPTRTATVVEYDQNTKTARRGGRQFKLRLQFVEMTFVGGRKERSEWYAPVEGNQ